jgi:hypothetical protein
MPDVFSLSFTHLVPEEISLARAFITQNPIAATSWRFDEHLGDGMSPQPDWPPWLGLMAKTLTQRRVDLVGVTEAIDWIIELKPRANIHAIGQLLVYQKLYVIKHPDRPQPRLALVAAYKGFDLDPTLEEYNISYFQV